MKSPDLIIQTDGGARGNPGPAASAFVVMEVDKQIHKDSFFLGVSTNNQAEYRGVLLALEWVKLNQKDLVGRDILFLMDSELIVRQINGIYKVKDEHLKKLHRQVLDNILTIKNLVSFKHIPRAQNKDADFLVNEELDKHV